MRWSLRALTCVTLLAAVHGGNRASAFLAADRWDRTASGWTGSRGTPVTLTWSIVPDGTTIPQRGPSALVSHMDAWFGAGPDGADLTLRPWFRWLDAAFARWSELGGVEFRYEPADDGAEHRDAPGLLGTRGDVRLAAAAIDGPGGTLAYSQFPSTGDLVLDLDDRASWTQPVNDHRRLRNVLMHEIGHALGLDHIVSSDADFLMEPALNLQFDGPQLDDVRGLHALYGDRAERSGGGLDNDRPEAASWLGTLRPGQPLAIGAAGTDGLAVAPHETDFVSIAGRTDVDFFRFRAVASLGAEVTLTPLGGTFRQGRPGEPESLIDAAASNDLALAAWNDRGERLAFADATGRGGGERLQLSLPQGGEYLVSVTGRRDVVQLYRLELHGHVVAEPRSAAGVLCAAVLIAWRRRA